ncbi:DUF3179 domain-containing protein [Shewanella sp. Scap07]|uniref:DUF3179 domain-containing (seleno)protein n=1 Tax=Shewanella sp. Scap07 TaxID=2589987 RepID=UPI0015C0CD52|nr:DUF3179 domain-containing (seleno)protein [Shewanella sp. Scap07]QLE87163.1 DUF3179 domain-containing protein [Shewanella sp. Scap07]
MNYIFWFALITAMAANVRIFWDLSDFSQLLNIRAFPRSTFMKTWYMRNALKWTAILFSLVAIATNHVAGVMSWSMLSIILTIGFVFYYAGLINPRFMMPQKMDDGHFVDITAGAKKIRPHNEVMVMVNNGHARAHADFEMWRPHIAGNKDKGLGGEDIVMTYCSLSNVCVGVRPYIDGERLDLHVATQLENNLLMEDKNTGEPIQQLGMARECNLNSKMEEFPTFKMPYEKFCAAYPEGEVFVESRPSFFRNPLGFLHEVVMDGLFYLHVTKQRNNEEFLFNTCKNIDPDQRLHKKEHVWGLNVGDVYTCYNMAFLKSNSNLVNTVVGGKKLVIHYDEQFESVGVWYNPFNEQVTQIDFFGQSNLGQLERVESVKAGIFYGVWYNFYPQTTINLNEAQS